MAKKAERKLREEQERRVSGVPARSNVKVAAPPAATSGKAAKRARATATTPDAGSEGGATGAT